MTTEYNEFLTIGKIAAENEMWIKYAQYCFDRDKGLRKQAFERLNDFLKNTESWTDEEKIKFVTFLCPYYEDMSLYCPFPHPLSEKLIKPTLEKWCSSEVADSNPFRWYGMFYGNSEYLKKALELNQHEGKMRQNLLEKIDSEYLDGILKLNSQDDQVRQILLQRGINRLWYSVHHLPDGYIGEPKEDLILIDELQNEIAKLSDIKLQQFWTEELEEYTELVTNYVEYKKSGDLDLEKWGEENHKRVSSGVNAYYYEK